jgi:ethanolamine utilization microcompartment shell protein EutL
MNHEGDLTAAQPELTPGASTPPSSRTRSWFARYPLVLFSATGAVVAAAIAVAAVLLLAQPNPSIEKMVPATHDVMVIANLNPSLAQKVNLLRAVHSFPDTRTDAAIAAKLDEALKQSGLSFTTDVQPWLGSEVGVSGKMNFESGADSPYALFATSRDDARAKAALATLRSGALGKKYTWRDETYNGISIASGTPTVTSEKPVAYSLVDHVVVLASSSAIIHEIIDTDQGRAARLVDSPDFKATMTLLPSDRVGMGYIAGKSIVAGVKKQMAKPSTLGLPALKTLDDLNALQGIGGAVSATGTGVAFDVAVKLDVNKLSPATRQAFNATGHPDAVLRWIPKSSDGFLAIANVDQSIKTLLSQYGSDPSLQASTDAVGLTGAKGILPHLTGDLGVEVELGNKSIPSGAILIGTNDAAAMNAFFGKLLVLAAATSQQNPGAGITHTTYRGTVITSWSSPSLSTVPGLMPSYAALDGMGILGSNLAEVKAVIDAHVGGSNITADPTYQAASAASLAQPTGILYVNIGRVAGALQKLSTAAHVDTKALGYLAPLQAFMLTATSQAGAAVERFFVVIK